MAALATVINKAFWRMILLAAMTAAPCLAADSEQTAAFAAQMAEIRQFYRQALYHSDPLHQDLGAMRAALAAFSRSWGLLAEPLWPTADRSGTPFFEDDRQAVGEIASASLAFADAGRPEQAHHSLGQIRPLLDALAGRDGGDGGFDEWMLFFDDKLAETADDEFSQAELEPAQFVRLCEQAGVLDFLGEQLARRAPARYGADPDFLEALENIAQQIRGLKVSILQGRRDPVRAALTDLRLSFDRFYLLYG